MDARDRAEDATPATEGTAASDAVAPIDRLPELGGRRFGVLRSRKSSPYFIGAGLAMMGDNIEHVITYWVLWQTFHSPLLVGFQIISHWLPFLLLSVYAGALAERYDCRRLIQAAQVMFMLVSLVWGILFLTGTLELWSACVLLVVHGMAGCLWAPAEQMMLYDFVGRAHLTSAVRLNATFRSLGILMGPVVGSALLIGFGPTGGIFANIVFYLPLTVFLLRTRYTGHVRDAAPSGPSATLLSSFKVLATVRHRPRILGMLILAALAAVTISAVLQTAMPAFADMLGGGDPDFAYGVLLFSMALGGVIGGLLLEATGWVKANAPTAVFSAVAFGASTVLFVYAGNLAVAVVALFIGGLARITSESTEQTIVQLDAPVGERGRVIGAYSMFGPGMSTFSGVTVGVLGALVSVPESVFIGGTALAVGALATGVYLVHGSRRVRDG